MPEPPRATGAIGVADTADVSRRAATALATIWPGALLRDLRALTGGHASLTYLADVDGGRAARVVVKMAPPGLPPVRNRDVLRQARLLRALGPLAASGTVAVPEVYVTDAGDPPDVPPLFVMEYVPGDSHEPLHAGGEGPASSPPSPAEVDARARAAAQMLAALHGIAPTDVGLGDEPVTSLEDEVGRWQRAFASCELPADTASREQECRSRLLAGLPAALAPVVVHGDWRLGNMLSVGGEVRAVIDWEIWSVGDPRIDLAWMMLMSSPDHPSASGRSSLPCPAPDKLLEWYEQARGQALPDTGWAQALVRYKQSAATALLVKNAVKRGGSGPMLDRMRSVVATLLDSALTYLP